MNVRQPCALGWFTIEQQFLEAPVLGGVEVVTCQHRRAARRRSELGHPGRLVSGLSGDEVPCPSRHFRANQGPGEGLARAAGVRHALADLRQGTRTVSGPTATALVKADAGVEENGQRAPGGGVATRRRREGRFHVEQRIRATTSSPAPPLTVVRLLVRSAARQADVRTLRVAYAVRVGGGPA